jgi:hypothetical protein
VSAATAGQASWTARALDLEGNPDNPDDYAEITSRWDGWLDDEQRAAEEAGAKGAIDWQRAEDATPAAEDFDHAADIMRLRGTVLELLGEFGSTGRGWNVARISDEHLARLRRRLETP